MSKRLMLIIMAGAFMCLPLASAWAELVHSPTELAFYSPATAYNGVTMFTPIVQPYASSGKTITYMIDMDGKLVRFWAKNSKTETVYDARLEENGTLSRACVVGTKPIGADPTNVMTGPGGGACGAIEEVDWNGNLVWRYLAYTPEFRSHHDYLRIFNKTLAQNTYLFVAYQAKTASQAVAKGATGAVPTNWSLDGVYEVDYSGTIVWKWSFFDHLCQSADPAKANYYPNVAQATGKFNINATSTTRTAPAVNWTNINSVGYNATSGHIVINSREFNELFVIDHDNTFVGTLAQNVAAAAGPGGDFLYRFGNPRNYNTGNAPSAVYNTSANSTNGHIQLWGAYGVSFIPAVDYTGGTALNKPGDILIFNNFGANGNPMGTYSQVWEVNPFISGWSGSPSATYQFGATYTLPNNLSPSNAQYVSSANLSNAYDTNGSQQSRQVYWKWRPNGPFGFYSTHLGSVQRLANGNTLACSGESGHMVELTFGWTASEAAGGTAPAIVWEYSNPINNGAPWRFNTNAGSDSGFQVAKAYRFGVLHPALAGKVTQFADYSVLPVAQDQPGVGVSLTGVTTPCRAIPCTYAVGPGGNMGIGAPNGAGQPAPVQR